MRPDLQRKLVAALVAPALLAAASAQGLSFMRCGAAVRMSCCCPGETAPAPADALLKPAADCCDRLSIPATPAQLRQDSTPTSTPLAQAADLHHFSFARSLEPRVARVPGIGPPRGPSIVLAHCALLL